MAVTVASTAMVGSTGERWRRFGFWFFLVSNALWVVWGWGASAYALIALQFCLAVMNIRGARKAAAEEKSAA